MKLIHTSDWHLGKMMAYQSRLEDQTRFIREFFLPLCDDERPDGVLLAGDVFDRSVAPAAAIRLFDEFVYALCEERGIPLYTITGNHDGADRFALGAQLLQKQGFTVISRLPQTLSSVVIGSGEVELTMLPYFDPAFARDILEDPEIRGFTEAYEAILATRRHEKAPGALQILMCHCFVSGAASGDSESPLFVGGSGEVPPELFEGYDYVALGHLHRPQKIGAQCYYSGSPMKFAFDEESQQKSVIILETDGRGFTEKRVPVTGQRNMRILSGTIEEIIEGGKSDLHRDDYIFARLEGPPVFEPIHKLRTVYPNTLGLEYISRGGAADGTGRDELRRSFKHGAANEAYIFSEFMRQICGEEPTPEDLRIFLDACTSKNAGRENG